ncbi:DUF7523 family protein [Halorubrum amylolyticum]|uniref:DUF7523 family protein n=1 Tax=Halorubrum amylolyticum TaxID=2508724 RepID=UPI001008E668|nr:hypothetical protein [Halorubrum amylolyticum]
MSLAAETREAARARPFVLDALRAGVLNHSAAAAWLADEAGLGDGEGDADTDAIATALRRFREELADYATADRAASVSMRSGVGVTEDPEDGPAADPLLRVGGAAVVPDGRDTAILATGAVDAPALAAVLRRLATAGVAIEAAGVAGETLVVVVGRRDGATAVRVVEDALAAVPTDGE